MKPEGTELSPPAISVIIPVLNESRNIGRVLGVLANASEAGEILVVDGGSRDGTAAIARENGARVISSRPGRGVQMTAGAAEASGETLWFLHADTEPAPTCAASIAIAMKDPEVVGGNCAIRFDGQQRSARFLSWLYPHLRKIGLLYGDSGIFVRRAAYEACGGFRPYPIFEDLDLVRRIRKQGKLAHVAASVTTSSRRFESRSFTMTFAFWSSLQALYWCGVPPERLGRMYYAKSDKGRAAHTPVDRTRLQPENKL